MARKEVVPLTGDIALGDDVRDSITGLTGCVVAITDWLNGCRRILVQPRELHQGKPVESVGFDIEQMQLIKRAVKAAKTPTGGPYPNPTRPDVPRR